MSSEKLVPEALIHIEFYKDGSNNKIQVTGKGKALVAGLAATAMTFPEFIEVVKRAAAYLDLVEVSPEKQCHCKH